MKKTIFLLIAIATITSLSAQEYIPFPPDSTSEWRVDVSTWNPNPWEITTWKKRYFFEGETTINGNTYHKLFASGEKTTEWSNGTTTTSYFENLHQADLRTEGSKVFILYGYYVEQLLFDYALQAGDTIPDCFINSDCYDPLVISSVDSILIGPRYHKRFNIENPWGGNSSWFIEGIGHEFGIFETACTVADQNSFFECYAENHEPIFPEGVVCDLTVDVADGKPTTEPILEIFPNPSQGIVSLSFNSQSNQYLNLRIVNVIGEIKLEEDWNVSTGKNIKDLDLSSMENGMYFVILNGENGEISGRRKIILLK